MRTLWRALPAVLIGATLLAPGSPAEAGWSCSYYRWDAPHQEWDLVAYLQPQDEFRETHVLHVDWDCEYCYVPAVPPRNPDDPFDTVQTLAADTIRTVAEVELTLPSPGSLTAAPMNPWDGPACPLVPPVWDAHELDAVGGIG